MLCACVLGPNQKHSSHLEVENKLGRNDLLTRQQPYSAEAQGKEGGKEGSFHPSRVCSVTLKVQSSRELGACAPGCALPVRPLGPYGSEHSSGATQERSVEAKRTGCWWLGSGTQWYLPVSLSLSSCRDGCRWSSRHQLGCLLFCSPN